MGRAQFCGGHGGAELTAPDANAIVLTVGAPRGSTRKRIAVTGVFLDGSQELEARDEEVLKKAMWAVMENAGSAVPDVAPH